MFESLTEKLNRTFRHLIGRGKLTEENMQETLKEVRNALLDADVALEVVNDFIKQILQSAMGLEISKHLSPSQELLKIINEKLVQLMGGACAEINFNAAPPIVVLMAGLQGSGKTTSLAKLAKWLKERQKKSVLVTSCDVYRPAAIHQLEVLAKEVGVNFYPSESNQKPVTIAENAILEAKKQFIDVVLIDTAGRLHIDEAMMAEIKQIHAAIRPAETLFVVDGMTGQDAAKTAKAFNEALPLTGVVVTKLDGDARGGAILSVRHMTGGKPIKFIGVGEKIEALEPFYPDRMASRILGMGDILSLIEELERKVDKAEAEKLAKKVVKGSFDLEDFRSQLVQMQSMGGLMGLMDKMPGMGGMSQTVKDKMDDKILVQMVAIINSMTRKERRRPLIINGSRKRRIALGSGTDIQDVNRLLKQFSQMQKMMEKMSKKGGMARMLKGLQGRLPKDGSLPPGGFPFN